MDEPEFNKNPDKSYGWAKMDFAEQVAVVASANGLTGISKLNFDTISKIETYNRIVTNFANLSSDVSKLKDFSQTLATSVDSFTPIDTTAPFQTFVKETSSNLITDIAHLLPEAKAQLSEGDYRKVEYSTALLMWTNANVSQGRAFPGRYSVEELQLLEGVMKEFRTFLTHVENGDEFDGVDKARKQNRKLLKLRDIPKVALVLGNVIKYSPIFSEFISKACQSLNNCVSHLGDATSGMMDWGDFKTNPIGVMVNVVNGMVGVITSGGFITASAMNLASETISIISKNTDKKTQKRIKEMSPMRLIGTAIGSIAKTITSALSGVTSLIANVFQATFTAFTSTLTSVLTLLKSIAETSPIIKTISEYLSLALSMFFLPFFTEFGEPILNVVMNVLTTAMEMGAVFQNWLQEADGSVKEDIDNVLSEVVTNIKDLGDDFESFVTEFAPLVPKLLDFTLKFAQVIIDHSDDIMNLLKTGIETMKVLVENNVIGTMLDIGKIVFEFISDNRGLVSNVVDYLITVIKLSLGFASWALNNMENVVIALFTSVGTVCGAIGGAQVGTLAAVVSFGLSIPASAAAGAVLGGSAGVAAAWLVINKWIKPATDYLDSIKSSVSHYASGGKIYGRRGGHIGLLGEAGEGEFAIPESKLDLFRGNNNIVLRFNKGIYNQKELEPILSDLQSEMDFTYIFE